MDCFPGHIYSSFIWKYLLGKLSYLDGGKEKKVTEVYDSMGSGYLQEAKEPDTVVVPAYQGPEKLAKLSEIESFQDIEFMYKDNVKMIWIENEKVKDILPLYGRLSENGKYYSYDEDDGIFLKNLRNNESLVVVEKSAYSYRYSLGVSNQGAVLYRECKRNKENGVPYSGIPYSFVPNMDEKLFWNGSTSKIDDSIDISTFEYMNSGNILMFYCSREDESDEPVFSLGKYTGNEVEIIDTEVFRFNVGRHEGYIRFIAENN